MTSPIRDFHFHLYFDPDQGEQARALGEQLRDRFGVAVGRVHLRPVGPHPRGSCQLTVPTEAFAAVTSWLMLNRGGMTVFVHASTGDDLADHSRHVLWLGSSEPLDLSLFGA